MRTQNIFTRVLMLTAAATSLAACGSGGASYSLLPVDTAFRQTTQTVKGKLDILFIVDNSNSMRTSQDELAREFPVWFQNFDSNNYDYRVAVGATDAWRTLFGHGDSYSRFRDGESGVSSSGVFIIDPLTPDRENILGVSGSGDERSFQSMQAIFDNPNNPPFRRAGSKLNIIIVSDEDDTSWDGSTAKSWNATDLHPVSRYTDYLDTLTGSTATKKNYVVHSLTVKDTSCSNLQGGRPHGTRIMNLAAASGGISLRICDPFSQSMTELSQNIEVETQDTFALDRTPIVDTIRVSLNGSLVPAGGWQYNSGDNSVTLLDPFKPQRSDVVSIGYDPAGVK
jgi:hypothetical protein